MAAPISTFKLGWSKDHLDLQKEIGYIYICVCVCVCVCVWKKINYTLNSNKNVEHLVLRITII